MRVVVAEGWLRGQGNDDHLRALSELVDLTVYGDRRPVAGRDEPQALDYCKSRFLDPIQLSSRPLVWFYRGLAAALDRDAPDVVHVISEPWNLLPAQVARWARRHPRTIFFVHGCDRHWWDVPASRRFARRLIARRVLSRADGFVAESTGPISVAQAFALKPGAVTGVVHTNPRDPGVFSPAGNERERSEARRRLGLPPGGRGFGFIGRLVPEKGPLLFVDAFEEAVPNGGAWAAIAGNGPLQDEIERRTHSPRLTYLGSLRADRLTDFYRSIDVLVVPSYRIPGWDDQGPRVVIEGMLSGCLLVGARSGAIPEMLDETGLLVDEGDVASLAAAIHTAMSDPATLRLGQAARQRAIELYSGESTARRLVSLWSRALATRGLTPE